MDLQVFILDVDGILTDGKFHYDKYGNKSHKIFGPDDSDALALLSNAIEIKFLSADKRGFEISKSRVLDMGYSIDNVSSKDRLNWIASKYELSKVAYMGDGFYDPMTLMRVGYGISTKTSSKASQIASDYITKTSGSERAISEAVLHLSIRFIPELFHNYCNTLGFTKELKDRLKGYYL